MLEKGQAQADLEQLESEVMNLESKIAEVSNSGEGAAETLDLTLETRSDQARVEINEEEDYIDITTDARAPPYPMDTWTLIEGRSLQNLSFSTGDYGLEGEDSSGVVAVRPVGGAGTTRLTYRVEFRNILAQTPEGSRLEKVDLRTRGQPSEAGDVSLVISNEGTEYDSGGDRVELSSGERIERQRTVVTVNIRG